MKSIKEAEKSIHKFLPAIHEKYNSSEPIVSVIIDCFYKLDLVKQSIQSVLNQDYQNVEIVLVDNGAKENVSKYLHDIYTRHKNIALIKFKENQFSWDDTEITVVICWNAALLNCKGDIVSHLSYDDMLSYDCCSRMAKLFTDNDNCVTAGPLPVSIDINGKVNEEFSERLRLGNKRTKYIAGKELALDFIQGSPNKYFGAP
ncbi:glycosyltransferase family 2 protein, partial [Candidatus Woesearchaeota archaeon]|nr:glycosyltransferase family 2 protein [Candidatus Woesearchaeota archaeon]